jgi:hypothetical protein
MNIGELNNQGFTEEIMFEDALNLIILPVTINGKTYRFLFDTGAPNVISPELQQQWQFKKIGKSSIKDSQGKSKKVQYVKLDKLNIGPVDFFNTAACIIDFKANPVLSCLDLDGIIGSNLMQFCTWQVDYSRNTIVISNEPERLSYSSSYSETQFKTNMQHAIKIDYKTHNATIKNLKIDYGSTGYLNVPDEIYYVLKEKGELADPKTEVGFTQSGIFGVLEADTFEISVIQSGEIGDFHFGKIEILSGGKGLLGTKLLKNYIVTMNWPNGTIGFENLNTEIEFVRNRFGFSPTFLDGIVIVKSVIIDGPAYNAGLRPGMIIHSLDDFSLENINEFCSFILSLNKNKEDKVNIIIDQAGTLKTYEITILSN